MVPGSRFPVKLLTVFFTVQFCLGGTRKSGAALVRTEPSAQAGRSGGNGSLWAQVDTYLRPVVVTAGILLFPG